jgi:hypothetical protein
VDGRTGRVEGRQAGRDQVGIDEVWTARFARKVLFGKRCLPRAGRTRNDEDAFIRCWSPAALGLPTIFRVNKREIARQIETIMTLANDDVQSLRPVGIWHDRECSSPASPV